MTEQNPQNPPNRQMIVLSRRSFWRLIISGAIPLSVAILFVQVPIGCACGNPAINILGSFTRSQKAYFLENKILSKSPEDLNLGDIASMNKLSTRYEYSYELSGDRAYMYATPREVPTDLLRLGLTKADIYGLVSAIAIDQRRENVISVTCYAQKSRSGKPPQPQIEGNKFICPDGYQTSPS